MPTKKIAKPKAPEDPAVRAYYERFRDRLKALRKEAGLSQEDLADLLEIPLANYKQMESKRVTRFPLHKLEKLSRAVRESYEFIITGKNSRKSADDERRRSAVSLVRN
jgi:transcriptional regulator with XRE-family HTH domain